MMNAREICVELLAAAQDCAPSLQKKLALPRLVSLCAELGENLAALRWQPGQYTRFAVQEPKLREIFAPCFADRVVQGWLAARMRPLMERAAIEDSYANRIGKGTHAAIAKAQKLMRKPGNGWCLQLDVRNFFHSIHRPTLQSQMLTLLERGPVPAGHTEILAHAITALLRHDARRGYRSAVSSGRLLACIPQHKSLLTAAANTGLPIGGAASQSFANFYLNPLDHFIKHTLRVKAYTRYMDDLLLLADSPAQLWAWRDAIGQFLHTELRLSLHPGKEQLTPARQGIRYLGYQVYPHYLHSREHTVKTLKARLDFFKHLLRPEAFPLYQHPLRGPWLAWAEEYAGENVPLEPSWVLLKRMEATINSYLGIMDKANNARLCKQLYEEHFGFLRTYFVPAAPGYAVIHAKKRFLHR